MKSLVKFSALSAIGAAFMAASAGGAPDAVVASGTDCHMHVKSLGSFPQDAERVLSALEGAGLQRACILSGGYQKPEDCKSADCPSQRKWTMETNDWTLQQARSDRNLLPCL